MQNIIDIKATINNENLTFLGSFIDYCKDNSLKIDKNVLEKLHKEKLVFPALKVYHGIGVYKKIYIEINGKADWRFVYVDDVSKFKVIKMDKRKYYTVGGLSMDRLNHYQKNKMIEDPSKNSFKHWDKKVHPGFYTNYKKLQNQYEFIYDRNQILAIKIALPYLMWFNELNSSDKNILRKNVQKKISSLYKFLNIYSQMKQFYEGALEAKRGMIADLKNKHAGKELRKEWIESFYFDFFPSLNISAEKIISENKITKNYIEEWRSFLAEKSLINESQRSNKIKRAYLKAVNEKILIEAEDINYMIHIVNTFLYFLTKKKETVKQVLGDTQLKCCAICGSSFASNKDNQVTCGNPYCIKEHKNQTKRNNRLLKK